MKRILIAIPTYNEANNVRPLLELLAKVDLQFDLLFIDDNSPDGTAELLESMRSDWPNMSVLKRSGKLGIGSAHKCALEYAYGHHYDYLATLDADLTHDPGELPKMLAKAGYLPSGQDVAGGAEIVVASRHLLPDSLPGWNMMRRFLTKAGYLMTRFFLKMPYDATGALRVYDLKAIPEQLWSLIQSDGYAFFYESLFILWHNGYLVAEIPVKLPARTYGSSKMSYQQMFVSVLRLVSIYTRVRATPELFRFKPREAEHTVDNPWRRVSDSALLQTPLTLVFDLMALKLHAWFSLPHIDHLAHRYFKPEFKVLRLGCRNELIDRNLRHWLNILSVDESADQVYHYNRTNRPYSLAKVAALSELEGTYDAAYAWEDLERRDDGQLAAAAKECFRLLKPGARLLLTAGSRRGFVGRLIQAGGLISRLTRGRDRAFFQERAYAARTPERLVDIFVAQGFVLIERVESLSVGPVCIFSRQGD